MRLRSRLSRQVARSGVVFGALAIALSLLFFQYTASVSDLLGQAEPALEAMESLLLGVYQDDLLLIDYLSGEDAASVVGVQDQLEQSTARSAEVIGDVETLIGRGVIDDPALIAAFGRATELNAQVERTRAQVMEIHLQDLQSAADLSFDKAALLAAHRTALTSTTGELSERIAQISARTRILEQQLLVRSRWYLGAMLVIFFGFIAHVAWQVRRAAALVAAPIDQTIDAMERFRSGDYAVQIHPSLEIAELGSLQEGINKVFTLVGEQARVPHQKDRIETQLLTSELADILDYLRSQHERGRAVSLSELGKHQGVTQPTIRARVKSLVDKGLLTVSKQGRTKVLERT